jgi:SAM-dependent methyltransferase
MSGTVDLVYLDAMYHASADPWHLTEGWYEARKRALIMSVLPRQRFRSGFEPGCSVGELTALLAHRCDRLLSVDAHGDAVAAARQRVPDRTSVRIAQMVVPDVWPGAGDGAPFDLVVLSEIGYYLSPASWLTLAGQVASTATANAVVLACHWRREFPERTQPTAHVHRVLDEMLDFPSLARYTDADIFLDVWSGQDSSVAEEQGLT